MGVGGRLTLIFFGIFGNARDDQPGQEIGARLRGREPWTVNRKPSRYQAQRRAFVF